MEAAAAHLLDFSQEFDIKLLEQIIAIAYDANHRQRAAANEFLVRMKDHPDMWKRADAILESSNNITTKFFGLQVLGDAILTRWKIIPSEQQEGIRNYVVGKIITLSATPELLAQNASFLSRLNLVLVNILKHDWPHNWPSFISDLVSASKTSESLCENNMQILQLLSEEVFDFSIDSMTAAKAKSLKSSLNLEFSLIFELCQFILEMSQKRSLLTATLKTLQRFLSWIPLGYVFETPLIQVLISVFFPQPAYRTLTIDCLTEIASLPPSDVPEPYHPSLNLLLVTVLQFLKPLLPLETNLVVAYDNGTEEECLFVSRLALFFSTLLKTHLQSFEQQATQDLNFQVVLVESLTYLVMLSEVDDEEIFKICLDFWNYFTKDLYTSEDARLRSQSAVGNMILPGGGGSMGSVLGGGGQRNRNNSYSIVLQRLRHVIIDKMAKPEEVIIVEDENGNIVREMTKHTEVIAQYKTMRETVIYLTHLNYENTESIMLSKLEMQVDGGMFSWQGLNTLCWAIGSISGAMSENDEKRFLVTVIKDLLRLCEEQRGKDNKAVVASNIMYIVGQYPRFLRAHWKFLKTVINKLFEFMHEHHPGVQDMACDTFFKIAQKCKRKFMTIQNEETQPFILTLIADLSRHVNDLQPHQVHSFYEAVACMLSDRGPGIHVQREIVIVNLMELPNSSWRDMIARAGQDVNEIFHLDAVKEFSKILKTNSKVCSAAGSIYIHQLSVIYLDILNIYHIYSEHIAEACQKQGEVVTRYTLFKAMRGVKSDILDLMTVFLETSVDLENGPQVIMTTFLPQLMFEVLTDYNKAVPSARDSGVLTLFATAVTVLRQHLTQEIPQIMNAIFEPTLEMITKNMLDFPDHRIAFFRFLREANEHCFYGLFSIPSTQQKLVIDSIVWAFKHTERNISETGLEIFLELLQNVGRTSDLAQPFYQQYLLTLTQDVLGIMTDRLHKSGFKQQATILQHIFLLLTSSNVTAALYNPLTDQSAVVGLDGTIDNKLFAKDSIAALLLTSFPHLTRQQVILFVNGLFDISQDLNAFKQHLRDFLITIKEFEAEDNSDLFIEEVEANAESARQRQWEYRASVPGLLTPQELYESYGNNNELL